MAIAINNTLRNYMVNTGVVGILGNGTAILRVYNGNQPSTAGGSTAGCSMLVQISAIGWAAASNGTAALSTTYLGTAGVTGTAGWARLSDSAGTNYVIDGICGTAGTSDFMIDNQVISALGVVTLTSATLIQPGT